MEIFPYEKKAHLGFLRMWLLERGLDISLASDLPDIGFIAQDGAFPIAAGFLRIVEGNAGIVDGFISNKLKEGSSRHEALDLLTEKLISCAKEQGLSQLIAYTIDTHTIERAKKHGFQTAQHTLLCMKLGE